MRLIIIAVLLFYGFSSLARAQCNLAITSFTVQEDCSNATTPFAGASWSGGTPPFTVLIVTNTGGGIQQPTWSTFWSGVLIGAEFSSQATLSVTDAMGCTANSSAQWVNHVPMPPQVSYTVDCTVGPTLRWSGKYYTGISTVEFSGCSGPFAYNIANTTTGATWSGDIAADWIAEPFSAWHFGLPLTPGNYFVDIFPINALPGLSCNAGALIECYVPSPIALSGNSSDCGINFNLRAALSGPLPSGTLMSDQLRAAGLVPVTEPFSAQGYAYVGSAPGTALTPSLLMTTGINAIVDWVVVELRSAADPTVVLHSRPALIQRDGDVVGMSGSTTINAPLPSGSYHVALRHRNHLGIMTASPRQLLWDQSSTMIDFRLSSTPTYGTDARTAVGTVQCLWPGDAVPDGNVRYVGSNNDRDPILIAIGGSTPTNVVSNVYSPLDVNLDGSIRYVGANNDRDPILTTIGGSTPTNTRTQQLP
jgi:hypothetical protein